MAFNNKYSALATDADAHAECQDFDRELVETSEVQVLGSPMLAPRLNRAASSVHGDDVTSRDNLVGIARCLSMDSDASARSFDRKKFRESSLVGSTERRVSFSDIRVVHDIDDNDDDDDDFSESLNRLFDLDQNESKDVADAKADAGVPPEVESGSGDDRGELARVIEKCETLENENMHLTQQLRDMHVIVNSHRTKLDSQTKLVASLNEEVVNLQGSLWASVTGSQPRLSTFESQVPTAAQRVRRRRANTELGPPPPPKPKATRARAHTETDVGRLALPPHQKKKRPSRLPFTAFFGRSQSAENSDDEEEEKTLIESQEENEVTRSSGTTATTATATTTRMRTQSEMIPRPASSQLQNADESHRVRSKSYPSERELDGLNDDSSEYSARDLALSSSYPALQHQVSVLESKLMTSRRKQQERESLEKKFLDMKLEHATKCAEFEELQLQFSANANEQQSVVNDLNTALVDKINLKSQADQLRDRLEDLTKDYQLLQQNHLRLQNHIDATSRKSSVFVSSATTSTPAPPVASNWRMSFARRFSSLTSTVDDSEGIGRKSADKNRERSKTHHAHGEHRRHRKKHRKGKHSKHTRSKSEVTATVTAKTDEAIENAQQQQIGRKSLPPQPLFLATKSPKEKLDVSMEDPRGNAENTDYVDNADVRLSQFRGWFGGTASSANVKTSKNGYDNLQEELSHATTSPLLTNKTVVL